MDRDAVDEFQAAYIRYEAALRDALLALELTEPEALLVAVALAPYHRRPDAFLRPTRPSVADAVGAHVRKWPNDPMVVAVPAPESLIAKLSGRSRVVTVAAYRAAADVVGTNAGCDRPRLLYGWPERLRASGLLRDDGVPRHA